MKIITRPKRTFLPDDFELKSWEQLAPFYANLLEREFENLNDLKQFLKDRSEVESYLEENFAWRYIATNCDTEDESKKAKFMFFVEEIQPQISPLSDKLNKKVVQSRFVKELPQNYKIYQRELTAQIEIFREENIEIYTEIEKKAQEFGEIASKMEIEHEGKRITLQQAGKLLESPEREVRESVYRKMAARRLQEKEGLDTLLTDLIKLRDKVGKNADFKNFRDYKFVALNRFDYTAQDCEAFHDSVQKTVLPVIKAFQEERRKALTLEVLKPWDLGVDVSGKELKPFKTSTELVEKTITGFAKLDPKFGEYLEIMRNMNHFDLDSRSGKAPGGFNYPLYEIGVPFIFMNAVGSQRDLETMVHEGGHAIHSFLTRDLEIADLKSTPSEVAELASQAMELISMDFWDLFYDSEEDLKIAKKGKLEDVIAVLPWVCMVDKFQHWLYVNPTHFAKEREDYWVSVWKEFSTGMVDFTGFEDVTKNRWQNQLHIFEVPFYYIEYAFSQLGSIALWKNYLENPEKGLAQYKDFMKLGNTKSIPEIYKAAGIDFNFSQEYIQELMDFVLEEYNKIK